MGLENGGQGPISAANGPKINKMGYNNHHFLNFVLIIIEHFVPRR